MKHYRDNIGLKINCGEVMTASPELKEQRATVKYSSLIPTFMMSLQEFS
jgi:hypothetical protein